MEDSALTETASKLATAIEMTIVVNQIDPVAAVAALCLVLDTIATASTPANRTAAECVRELQERIAASGARLSAEPQAEGTCRN